MVIKFWESHLAGFVELYLSTPPRGFECKHLKDAYI